MSNFGKVLPAMFGWGLLTLLLALFGTFSVVLNGLQTLNGLFCFDRVRTESNITEREVSIFAISGYVHNHYIIVYEECVTLINTRIPRTIPDDYPFCEKWNETGQLGFTCTQRVQGIGRSNTYAYAYILDVNCTSGRNDSRTFQVSLTPGSFSMTGVQGVWTGYSATAVVQVDRSSLSQNFYIIFTSVCAAVTGTIFLLRASMRTLFVYFCFRLSNSVTFYWVYRVLERYGFFDLYNPYLNEPYNLVKGEKFYMMEAQSGDDAMDFGGHESGRSEDEVVKVVDSFARNSSKIAYKFTYDNGGVYAHSKDHSEFETFEAKVKPSVASVIKEYLQRKSESACILNDKKSQFLSLSECCKLAKEGYTLVEKIADKNYHMYGKKQIDLNSNVSTFQPERELSHFSSRSDLLERTR